MDIFQGSSEITNNQVYIRKLQEENEKLKNRLAETQETLEAIQSGRHGARPLRLRLNGGAAQGRARA
jgi:predicted ATP-grasp superfamily ATP-dependent carboligase